MVLSQGKISFDKASGATTAGRRELVSAARIQLNVSRVQAVIEHAGIAVTKWCQSASRSSVSTEIVEAADPDWKI